MALEGIESHACALLVPDEIATLEWLDDVEDFQTKGCGGPEVNWAMTGPLVQSILDNLHKVRNLDI